MLTFDVASHKYFFEGRPVPGVNEILTSLNLQENRGSEVDMLRGTYVHKACELHDNGVLDELNLDPFIKPYLDGWKRFRREICVEGFTPLATELMLYSKYGYAGRLDCYGPIGQIPTVIDIKTGEPGWITGMKLAAYEQLIRENETTIGISMQINRLVVKLDDQGDWKPYYYKNRKDKELFLSAVSLYHYRDNGGK